MSGPWEDYAPKAKKESGPWDDYSAEAQRSTLDKLTAPFRQGIASAAEGYQSTAHETGNDGTVSDVMGSVAKAVRPEAGTYTPAHVTLNPKTWGDIPKAVAEAAPGMAPDLAAGAVGTAIGGPIGGVIGAAGSYALRNYGNDARGAATSRGASGDSELTAGDKARALLMSGVGGLASRVGLGALGTPVKAEAGSMASQLLPQFAKGAGIDAATGVGQEAAHQGLIDQKLDVDKLGGAAVTGAGTGVALRGASAIKDGVAASKFKDTETKDANPVANDLLAVESPHTPGSGSDSFLRVQKVTDQYANKVSATLKSEPVSERLAALKEHDPLDPTTETIANIQSDLKAGRKPAQSDLDLVQNRLGDVDTGGPSLPDLFQRQATINQLKSKGNWDEGKQSFTGGASSTKFVQSVLNPMSKFGGAADAGALVYAATGHTLPGLSVFHAMADPVSAVSIPIAQAGIFGGLHALDRITGNRSPMKQFTDRFSSEPSAPTAGAPGSPDSPNSGPQSGSEIARAVQLAREAGALNKTSAKDADREASILARDTRANAEFINRQRDKEAKTVAVHERGDAELQNRQVNADQRTMAQNAAALERQRAAALAKEAKTEFEGPSEDATLRIRVARVREHLAARAEAMEIQAQKAQEKSEAAAAKVEQKQAAAADKEAKQADREAARRTIAEAKAAERAATIAKKSAEGAKRESARANTKSEPAPETTLFVHQDGTRDQPTADIKVSKSAYANGFDTRMSARRDLLTSASDLQMSADGKSKLPKVLDTMLGESGRNSNPTVAKGLMFDQLSKFSPHDAGLLLHHLKNAIDPSTGHTYFSTWE